MPFCNALRNRGIEELSRSPLTSVKFVTFVTFVTLVTLVTFVTFVTFVTLVTFVTFVTPVTFVKSVTFGNQLEGSSLPAEPALGEKLFSRVFKPLFVACVRGAASE
ncbi:MAG: hypothetical protein KatS3mg029_0842 [Saprospiraceae bacterium]|nr:MAG: hypothetical protein KatS3mg029_0842 [Saprospiraceae bacterium]